MADTFYIKRGDTAPAILYKRLPAPRDISGGTVRFQMRNSAGVTVLDAVGEIVDPGPDAPVVRYDWTEADTAAPGTYEAEFRVTYSDGGIETFPNIGFIVVIISEDVV